MTDINVVDPAQPVTILAAESGIHVGVHTEANWFGLTVNTDTLLSTSIAAVIVLALAFYLRSKVTASGVPSGVQLFWEAITVQTRNQIESAIGMKIAPFVLPLAVTLFVFILAANWLSVFPWQYRDETGIHEFLKPAAADINFDLDMWVAMEAVSSDTEILISADIPVWTTSSYETLYSVPIAARFDHGEGRVLYTAFHNEHEGTTLDMYDLLEVMVRSL